MICGWENPLTPTADVTNMSNATARAIQPSSALVCFEKIRHSRGFEGYVLWFATNAEHNCIVSHALPGCQFSAGRQHIGSVVLLPKPFLVGFECLRPNCSLIAKFLVTNAPIAQVGCFPLQSSVIVCPS